MNDWLECLPGISGIGHIECGPGQHGNHRGAAAVITRLLREVSFDIVTLLLLIIIIVIVIVIIIIIITITITLKKGHKRGVFPVLQNLTHFCTNQGAGGLPSCDPARLHHM